MNVAHEFQIPGGTGIYPQTSRIKQSILEMKNTLVSGADFSFQNKEYFLFSSRKGIENVLLSFVKSVCIV